MTTDPIGLLCGFLLARFYDLLKFYYYKTRPFPLTLKTGMAEMHHHGGDYELMLTQQLGNTDLRKVEIRGITHELGYPKLEKVEKEYGVHTDAKFPFTLEGEDSKSIRITYKLKEGMPKRCKLKTNVEHKYGMNRDIEDIDIVFM